MCVVLFVCLSFCFYPSLEIILYSANQNLSVIHLRAFYRLSETSSEIKWHERMKPSRWEEISLDFESQEVPEQENHASLCCFRDVKHINAIRAGMVLKCHSWPGNQ